MARPEKVAVVDEIRDKLGAADAAVLTEYRGLSVSALAELRRALRPAGTEYKVFKNTLARRAIEAAGIPELLPLLEGPVAIAFVRGDAVVAAKALRDFRRANDALVLKGGLLGGAVISAADIEALAEILPRDVLLATIAGTIQAPLVKLAGLLQAFTRSFAYGLSAYIDQRGPAEAPEAPAAAGDAPEAEAEAEAPTETAPSDGAGEPDAADAPTETEGETETEGAEPESTDPSEES